MFAVLLLGIWTGCGGDWFGGIWVGLGLGALLGSIAGKAQSVKVKHRGHFMIWCFEIHMIKVDDSANFRIGRPKALVYFIHLAETPQVGSQT